jgi:exodeoxyribonuclease III
MRVRGIFFDMTFKIASWNVNSIKARLTHVQAFLTEQKPDILFLQELKGEILPDISNDYQAIFKGQKAYNGVAILSRSPARLISDQLDGDDGDEQARYMEVEWNDLRLINVYLPNGNPLDTDKFNYKIKWMERLFHRLNELRVARTPFLIGGDFNVIPEDRDCFDPNLWRNDALYHPDTVRHFRSLLNLGLTDAFRVFNQNSEEYTFWDYQAGAWPRNKGIRIDHFLASPTIADRLIHCIIDKSQRSKDSPSDHVPIILEVSK